MIIRPGTPPDIAAMAALERAAATRFRDIGLTRVADHCPLDKAVFSQAMQDGLWWVAEAAGGRLAGFLVASPLPKGAFIEEISVHPDFAGQRIGASLMAKLESAILQGGGRLVMLSTFRDVPWNAPYYASLGFEEVAQTALDGLCITKQLAETEAGLDPDARVFMRKILR